ncbi:MAG TPA: hypothetical protein VNI01_04735, partial [Elusimicrobiota bacterium]|nr:hypothetical protein [Elusimicrobiota bacterium]
MNVRILSAAFLIAATAAPSRAQDEGETRRRFVPGVYSNRRVERDEDDTQQAPKQDFGTLLGNFADSVNHTVFPKNDVVGDVELFRKKSDNELVRYGSDFPRWTLLTEAVIPAEDKYNQAYQKLVEKALIPLAGEAGPMVKELFERLKPIGKEAGDDSKEINDFSQESEQLTSQFPQFPPTPPSGNPLQLDKMQPIQEKSQTRKAQFEDLKDMVKQINRIVLQAKNGLDGAKMLGDMARQDVKKAGDLDNLALGKAAQNRAGGSSSSSSGNGRSEPVLQGALERLQAAVKKGEKAQEAMDKFSDEDPEKGPLMKAVKAV